MDHNADTADNPVDNMAEEAWLAEPPKRSRLRPLLVAVLGLALVFFAGVQVQKRYGEADAAAAAVPTGFPGAGAGGGAQGNFTPPGGDTQSDSLPGAGQTQNDTGAEDDSTSVIGTLVSVKNGVWTVKDLGGNTHQITIGDDVRVIQETQLAADAVKDGATVDIDGTTDDQGNVTATSITVR